MSAPTASGISTRSAGFAAEAADIILDPETTHWLILLLTVFLLGLGLGSGRR